MESYVFSKTLRAGNEKNVKIVSETPKTFVENLRAVNGKDIWLMGGGELTREFLRADLVDEIHLGIVPMLLGEGIPAFKTGFPERKFSLVENRTYSQGLIALRYERNRAGE
jgi:dihydrofolate reductase